MSWCVFPWVYTVWDSLCILDLSDYFLSHVREVFDYNLFKYFLRPFLFLFFWDPYNSNVGGFSVVPEVSEIVFNSFLSFSLFCSSAVISTILSSSSLILSSASVILYLFLLVYFSFQLLCCSSLFCCSLVLLDHFKHFLYFFNPCLHSISEILDHLYYQYSEIPISSSFIWSCKFLPCSFICDIFFCHLIFLFFSELDCVPVLLIIWPEASNTGVCRLLGRDGSWC